MKVGVTGGTGFIGSHLITALAKSGYGVSCAVEPGATGIPDGVRMVTADIGSGDAIPAAFAGVDHVIHLAARNHVLKEASCGSLAKYRRVNVEGTRNVIRAASLAGAEGFVHLSSVKAMGEESDRILDENSPCLPVTPYGISKLESEEVVRVEASKNGMRAIILRLPMVYGPRNKGNPLRMIRWADRGLPFPLFQPENLRSIIYVENVVAAILAVLKSAPDGVSTYILRDREDYSTRTVYSAICRELGKRPRFVSVPSAIARLGGLLSDDFRKVTGFFRVSSAKIERKVGFIPGFSLEEGIRETVRWYKVSAR